MKKIESLLVWLKDSGAEFPDISIKEISKSENGVEALNDIPESSFVVKIPRKLLIHSNLHSKYGDLMDKYNINTPKKHLDKLVLFILDDKNNEKSYFKSYYDVLPKDLSHLPIFWTDDELLLLENSHIITSIMNRRKILSDNYNQLSKIPNFSDKFSFEDYCTLRSIVGSRNFSLNIDGDTVSAMVPLGDMFNHNLPPDVKWTFDSMLDCYTMKATKDIKKGQEITDSYGGKPNNEYLLYYGFTMDDNNIKCKTMIDLNYNEDDDDIVEVRRPFINSNQKYLLGTKWDTDDINRLLSQLRIISADINDLQLITEKYSKTKYIGPISKTNEKKALELFNLILDQELDNYGSTLEDNKKQLSVAKNKNEKQALKIIIREKENIKFFQKKINELLEHLFLGDFMKVIEPSLKEYIDSVKSLR